MKGSMDEYIDEIRNYDQKLEAVGYHVDDDDLVFYALKGLPEEYRPIRAALNAKGDVAFNDLATILKNEESQILRDEGSSRPKVFLAKQTPTMVTQQLQDQAIGGTTTQMLYDGVLGSVPQQHQIPMYQTSGPFYPTQFNRNVDTNNRGSKRDGYGMGQNKVECQICGKTNHTAMYCYHRQNLQYQPQSNQYSRSRRNDNQSWNGTNQPWKSSNQMNNQSWNGTNQPWKSSHQMNNQTWNGSFQSRNESQPTVNQSWNPNNFCPSNMPIQKINSED
ncbi:hypothetical protein Vadar_030972 [Vaccinium darrowii]|uniref:Uncharacterized protein n=1 Tax=Vaccinium darrowii TaxID=229202 RepID=A0ACB7Y2Z9_9ERIC|nr:hypothetical protein Vadar_030972 [Vaccinium darrowii]